MTNTRRSTRTYATAATTWTPTQLQPVSTAATLRLRDGEALVTDGPFAETKEQLGGYYVVEAGSLDEALGIAARIPSARYGSIEVRPVMGH